MNETTERAAWRVVESPVYPSIDEIVGPSFPISVVMTATDLTSQDYAKRRADVRLIAAAPSLLSALRTAEDALAIQASYRATDQARIQRALETTRAALALAEGTHQEGCADG